MKWLIIFLLAIIAWLLHRLAFIVKAYRGDIADLRTHLSDIKSSLNIDRTYHSYDCSTKKISLNSASKGQLLTLPKVGKVTVQRIIAARPFKQIEELQGVEGVTPRLFELLKSSVSI